MNKIAIIRIRGSINMKQTVKDTLNMLNLQKKNHCVIVEETPTILGMIKKAKDYITWGKINEETEKKLLKLKQKTKNYALQPPIKGYGRKGIKIPFTKGGALGNRKEKINDLIQRMIR